jgi:HlyD family secretion protein
MSKRTIWIIVIVAAVVLIAFGIYKKVHSSAGLAVETAKVSRQTITETVNASGKVQPEKEVKISADISGEIIELRVKEGDRVKKGDLLARIKPDQYQSAVDKALAGVNSAKATVANSKASKSQAQATFEKAKLIYERNKKLYSEKAIAPADFQNTEADYKVAQAQLEGSQESVKGAEYNLASATAALQDAEESLKKTSIYSPMDGIVSKLSVELGERVVGTMQMAGTEMMRIANLANMRVQVEVNENDIVRLKENDTADIDIDAFRNETFKGIVTEISNSAESTDITSEKVTNFIVKIRILESSYKHLVAEDNSIPTPFRPGMSANVSIQTQRAANVLAVPILAVTVRGENGKKDTAANAKQDEVVFLYNNGKVKQQKVKTGIQDDTYIEIKEGLKEGDEVVSGPYRIISKELKDGEEVERSKAKTGSKS